MAYFRKGKISPSGLFIIAAIAAGSILYLESSKRPVDDPIREQKVAAAEFMMQAMELVKEERIKRGIPIDREIDPNETGMIGDEYTDLTTSLGSLAAKRTSTNPNFAGVIVDMLHDAGVKPGDRVAVSFSGSFPALNIAVLSAIKTLKLNPVIISSIGASMYGANLEDLTWLDMEKTLREKRVFPFASVAASLGGITSTKGALFERGVEIGLDAIHRSGVMFIDEKGSDTLKNDISRRMAFYDKLFHGQKPAAYINVGGSLLALGNCPEAYGLPTGLLTQTPLSDHPDRGVIFRMNELGIPIVHLLNIKQIATR
ncbi:MAG: poly-gamma-glutamate system protein, partial [Desulfobacterales bacterium]